MAQARTTTRNTGDEARIGRGTRIRGRIAGDGDLTVEGEVEGDIALRGALTIAEGAQVSADAVEAQTVTIAGSLEANVTASGAVRIAAGSKVRGDVRGSAVSIEEGAEFAGRLDCDFDLPPELSNGARR